MIRSLICRLAGRAAGISQKWVPALVLAVLMIALAAMAHAARPSGKKAEFRLDDFTATLPPGKTFEPWQAKKDKPIFGKGELMFYQFVHNSPAEHYIHLKTGADNSFLVAYGEQFHLKDWPVLEWEWKVTVLPLNGDVRVAERDDQAGSICVAIDLGTFGFNSALCYAWENKGPKNQVIVSSSNDDARYIILRSGEDDGVGSWFKERRDVLKDYIKAFGAPPKETGVVALMIDSNSTDSTAEVFYRNLYQRKR